MGAMAPLETAREPAHQRKATSKTCERVRAARAEPEGVVESGLGAVADALFRNDAISGNQLELPKIIGRARVGPRRAGGVVPRRYHGSRQDSHSAPVPSRSLA